MYVAFSLICWDINSLNNNKPGPNKLKSMNAIHFCRIALQTKLSHRFRIYPILQETNTHFGIKNLTLWKNKMPTPINPQSQLPASMSYCVYNLCIRHCTVPRIIHLFPWPVCRRSAQMENPSTAGAGGTSCNLLQQQNALPISQSALWTSRWRSTKWRWIIMWLPLYRIVEGKNVCSLELELIVQSNSL